jgi:hypothetical protein
MDITKKLRTHKKRTIRIFWSGTKSKTGWGEPSPNRSKNCRHRKSTRSKSWTPKEYQLTRTGQSSQSARAWSHSHAYSLVQALAAAMVCAETESETTHRANRAERDYEFPSRGARPKKTDPGRQPDQAGEAACAAGSCWWTDPQPKKSAQ